MTRFQMPDKRRMRDIMSSPAGVAATTAVEKHLGPIGPGADGIARRTAAIDGLTAWVTTLPDSTPQEYAVKAAYFYALAKQQRITQAAEAPPAVPVRSAVIPLPPQG